MRILCYILVCLLVLFIVAEHLMAETELLTNGTFEDDVIGELPVGWRTTNWDPAGRVLVDKDESGGNQVLKVRNGGKTWQVAWQKLDLVPDTRYRVIWKGRTDGKAGGVVEIMSYPVGIDNPWAKEWKKIETKKFSPAVWTEYSFEFKTPPDPGLDICLKLYATNYHTLESWVCFDDLKLERIETDGLPDSEKALCVPTGNMIVNGGFEFGLRDWHAYGDRMLVRAFRLESENAYKGMYCLARRDIDDKVALVSNWTPAESGRRYYLKFALRGSYNNQKAIVELLIPDYYSRVKLANPIRKEVMLTTEWQEFSLEKFIDRNEPVNKLIVKVDCPGQFYLDGVSLTADKPAGDEVLSDDDIGVAVLTGKLGNIFDYGVKGFTTLDARNVGDTERTFSVSYEIKDLFGKVFKKDEYEVKLRGGESLSRKIAVDTSRRGRFNLMVRIMDENKRLFRTTKTGFAVLKPIDSKPSTPLGTNVHGSNRRHRGLSLNDNFDVLGRYGMAWVRLWWGWNFCEIEEGVYDWTEFDRQVAAAERAGLSVMPCLMEDFYGGASWRKELIKAGDFKAYTKWVSAVASRYKDRIKLWEIANEPNMLPGKNLDRYIELCKVTYNAIKQEIPDSVISACSTDDNMLSKSGSGMRYVRNFLDGGGVDYCDVLGLHPYHSVNSPIWQNLQGKMDMMREWAKATGGNQKVQITEAGVVTSQGGYQGDGTNLGIAGNYIQNWLIAWGNDTRYFHFAADVSYRYAMNLYDYELIPNAVLCALNVLAEEMDGSEHVRWIEFPEDAGGVYGVQYARGNEEQRIAIWCLGFPEKRKAILPLKCPDAYVVDMMGNKVDVTHDKDDHLVVPFSNLPSYLHLPRISDSEVSAAIAGYKEMKVAGSSQESLVGNVMAGEMWLAGYKPPAAGPFEVDKDGFVLDWLVFGPFADVGPRGYAAGYGHDYLEVFGGESATQLLPGMSVTYLFPENRTEWELPSLKQEIVAKAWHSKSSKIDFMSFMKINEHVVAYAYCNVTAPESMDAELRVGSDDGIRVWLNGKLVVDKQVYRGAAPDTDKSKVRLVKGKNRLLVKVNQDIGGWAFYLRFLDANGKPLHLDVGW